MFVVGTDVRQTNSIGNGAPVSNMEQQIFYTTDSVISVFDPYAPTSTFVRIKGAELQASETTNQTPYYDQFEEIGVKQGRTESNFEITQDYYGLPESIKKLKNQELWYAEGLQDDRMLTDPATGNPIFQEITYYRAKLVDFQDDKGDIFRTTGTGKYNTKTKFTVIKGITPTTVEISGSDNTATADVAETYDIVLKDLYGDVIDGSDLSAPDLAGEITSISLEKVSGTPTISTSAGANDSQILCTYTGTGTCTIRAKVVTKNGGTFVSADKTISVS